MKTPSPLPFSTTLVSPVTTGTPACARGRGHRLDDALQVGQREAFLEDEAGRQVQRHRARHRHVVDGAVHRQAADVAAGKEQRRDDVAVGGHHQAPGRHAEGCLVVGLAQPFVVEGALEEFVDQLRHGAAAAAVRHVDDAVPEVDRADVVLAYGVHGAIIAGFRAAAAQTKERPGRALAAAHGRGRRAPDAATGRQGLQCLQDLGVLLRRRPARRGRSCSCAPILSPSSAVVLLVVAAEAARRLVAVAEVVHVRAPGDLHLREHVPRIDVAERRAGGLDLRGLRRGHLGVVGLVEALDLAWRCRPGPLPSTRTCLPAARAAPRA